MGKWSIKPGEAKFRTGVCAKCGVVTTAYQRLPHPSWYLAKFCAECRKPSERRPGVPRLRTGVCVVCSGVTTAHQNPPSTEWYVPKYCRECVEYRIRMKASQYMSEPRKPKPITICAQCGIQFPSKRSGKGPVRTCSRKCGWDGHRKWASVHDRRKAHKHIRRAREQGTRFESVSQQAVINRDGLRCHVCRKLVNLKVTEWAQRPTIDHLIPLSQGGAHTLNNLRLAHQICNSRRGNVKHAQPVLL